ncbi:protein of unknown function [Bradyrhizobium vignae]|uniref:Uncharacterized protein n=1 Tax=Bradyrhizobium vignae TaxID=1549949 RepID=A0A2U3QBA1_9BRAD|nr:protein of unknown function [Bradyrhizobium vignae]
MKLPNSQQCIFGRSKRQTMTFTNLCGDRCAYSRLFDMINVIFRCIFVALRGLTPQIVVRMRKIMR